MNAPMKELYKLLSKNDAERIRFIMEKMPSDKFLRAKVYGQVTVIDYVCRHCNWEVIREVLLYYKKKGLKLLLQHSHALHRLWYRGYRNLIYELVRVGLSYEELVHLISCESEFRCLLYAVPNQPLFLQLCREKLSAPLLNQWLDRRHKL